MSLINTALQAASVLMNSQNSQWQRERENERGLTALEIEGLRQEHQLKMTYLQQELQQNAREQDRIRQAELRGGELINQAHLDGAKIRDSERYLRGTWKEAHFGNEQPPYVIFCTNPLQDLNPLKEEAFRIAPFQRTYDNFKARNAAYVGRLFSTITISETFKSEAEARSFFYRELNCPCIIIYGIFTGTGFGIYALTAGISPDQLRIDGQKVADWGVRIEKLWDISYNTIHAIKQKALDDAIKQIKKKAAETGNTLPTDPELLRQKAVELRGRFDVLEGLELYTDTHVGLCVQVMLDNYFSYYPRQVYEIKTPAFLEAKQKELTRLGIWEALKTTLLERYEVLKGRQRIQLSPKTELKLEIDTENNSSRTKNKEFCEVDYTTLRESKYDVEWEIKDRDGNWRKIFTFSPQQIDFKILPYTNPDYYWPTSNLHRCVDGEYQNSDKPYTYEWPNFSEEILGVQKYGSKYGFINSCGEEVIPCLWDSANGIKDDYLVVSKINGYERSSILMNKNGIQILPKENVNYINLTLPVKGLLGSQSWDFREKKNVYAIIDLDGNHIFNSTSFANVEYTTDNLYIIHNDAGAHLINRKGDILIAGKDIKYLGNNPEPVFIFNKKNTDYYFSPNTGKKLNIHDAFFQSSKNSSKLKINRIDVVFDYCRDFGEGYLGICVILEYSNKEPEISTVESVLNLLSKKTQEKSSQPDNNYWCSFEQIFSFTQDKQFHLDNVDTGYFRRNPYLYFSEGKIIIQNNHNHQFYFVDKDAIDWEFNANKFKMYEAATPYSEGLAAVKEGKYWGYIGHDERMKIPFDYEDARPFSEGYAAVKKNGKYGLIDKNCRIAIPFMFENISFFKKGYNCVCLKKGNIQQKAGRSTIKHPKWAIINKEGKILVM